MSWAVSIKSISWEISLLLPWSYTPRPIPMDYSQDSSPRDIFKNKSDHVTQLLETLQGLPSYCVKARVLRGLLRPYMIQLRCLFPTLPLPVTQLQSHGLLALPQTCQECSNLGLGRSCPLYLENFSPRYPMTKGKSLIFFKSLVSAQLLNKI